MRHGTMTHVGAAACQWPYADYLESVHSLVFQEQQLVFFFQDGHTALALAAAAGYAA